MSTLKLKGSTSGYVELTAPSTAGDNTITLPTTAGTAVIRDASNNTEVGTGVVIGSPASNTFTVTTNSTERIRIDSSGRMGIGTQNPTAKLAVVYATNGIELDPQFGFVSGTVRAYDRTTSAYKALGLTGDSVIFGISDVERARIDASGRLLIGTSSARSNFYNGSTDSPAFQIEGTSSNSTHASIVRNQGGEGPTLILGCSGGTSLGSNTLVSNGDRIGHINFQATDGAEFVQAANIKAEVDGTPGANDMPGRLVFSTTADGASSPTEQMRIDNAGNLKFNSGYGSAATAYGCRAWVNFNGTGTPAIRASGNVSSITDISAGYYVVNFTTAMPDANYAAIVTTDTYGISILGTVSTSGCQVQIGYVSNTSGGVTLGDVGTICCSFFR
jgi:hypothetical protein